MKRLILILWCFLPAVLFAQNKAFVARADKAYAEKDYVTAAFYYDKGLQNGTLSSQGTVPYFSVRLNKHLVKEEIAYIVYRLADSYRQYESYIPAERWYKELVDDYESVYPLARLWYSTCLRTNSKLDEAISQLNKFTEANKTNKQYQELAAKEITSCMFAKSQMANPAPAKIAKMGNNFNGDGGDFAINSGKNKYWFTSSRTIPGINKRLNQIYFSEADSASAKTRIDFKLEGKTDVQFGTPSVEATGRRMYLTVSYKEDDKAYTGIYLSRFTNQRWTAPQRLNAFVNSEGYTSTQPFITADGKHLYYSSNKPGGIGGTDIWMSELDIEGDPTNATNLGSTVNTTEDEQAPYYSEGEHKLVYSSKGFTGMGNFDLFESMDKGGNKWDTPRNLGYPYNSTKDDLYYAPDAKNEKIFYVSSDRASDCCLSLFRIQSTEPERSAVFAGMVIDCATNKPLADVNASLTDTVSKEVTIFHTIDNGKYQFTMLLKHVYALRLEKQGYFAKVIPIPKVITAKTDTLFNPVICQQEYEIDKPIVINNILYDFNKAILKPLSKTVLDDLVKILIDNPEIKVEISSHTDSYGPVWSNNRLSQNRAQGCVDYIISKGVARDRITARGYGSSVPLVPNTFPDGRDDPAGRRQNRRTEFKVLSADNKPVLTKAKVM